MSEMCSNICFGPIRHVSECFGAHLGRFTAKFEMCKNHQILIMQILADFRKIEKIWKSKNLENGSIIFENKNPKMFLKLFSTFLT